MWIKSALLERELGDVQQTLFLLDEAIKKYPSFHKFYLMAGQVCSSEGGPGLMDLSRARDYYQKGLQQCPDNDVLWCRSIRLEEQIRGVTKARSMAEMARLRLPKSESIWLESIRLERRSGQEKLAESVANKGLQECPDSGVLWAEELLTCPRTAQKQKSVEALKRCDQSPEVVCAVARLFERDRKVDKARKWFERAAALQPKLGDTWVYFYAFELRQQALSSASGKSLDQQKSDSVVSRCVAAVPNRGELWCSVAKITELRRADVAVVLRKAVEELLLKDTSSSLVDVQTSSSGGNSMEV